LPRSVADHLRWRRATSPAATAPPAPTPSSSTPGEISWSEYRNRLLPMQETELDPIQRESGPPMGPLSDRWVVEPGSLLGIVLVVLVCAVGFGRGRPLGTEAGEPLRRIVRQLVLHRRERTLATQQLESRHRRGPREGRLEVLIHVGARSRRDQLADDHVLLETPHEVRLALDGSIGQHPRGLLEGSGRQPRVSG